VPQARLVVVRWAESALAVDGALVMELQGSYVAMRAEEDGGPQMEGLRWAWEAVEDGHDLSSMLDASPGAERRFWELYWRPLDGLPAGGSDQAGRRQYAAHLAAQPVRVPASMSTSFLLRMALHLRS
jgi:hypothetical protein